MLRQKKMSEILNFEQQRIYQQNMNFKKGSYFSPKSVISDLFGSKWERTPKKISVLLVFFNSVLLNTFLPMALQFQSFDSSADIR